MGATAVAPRPNQRTQWAKETVQQRSRCTFRDLISIPAANLIRRHEPPKGEETSASDYFATSNKAKIKDVTPIKASNKPQAVSSLNPALKSSYVVPNKGFPVSSETNGRRSLRGKRQNKSHSAYKDDDSQAFLVDNPIAGDDIFAADVKKRGTRMDDEYTESESDEEVVPKALVTSIRGKRKTQKPEDAESMDSHNENNQDIGKSATKHGASSAGRKRKSTRLDEGDSVDLGHVQKQPKEKKSIEEPPAKKPRGKKEDVPESAEIQAIFDSIPTIKAPSPPPRGPDNHKFDWRAATGGNSGPPPSAGAKEMPTGADNCLVGLTFVFTGLLETISREEGQELVKRYGGKVTGAPSSKTSYVVLGSDAGPSKLEKIKALNIKTVNEDGLFELIRRLPTGGGDGRAAAKQMEKKRAEEQKVKREALQMEIEEKRLAEEAEKADKKAAVARGLPGAFGGVNKLPPASQLWTTKYAPTKLNQICGNKNQVEKIQIWLQRWPNSRKHNFILPGPDGSGKFRAILIHGPPGIGKTTAAHLAARLEGYDIIESNASDTRSKKLVEAGLSDVLNNNSLLGFFAGYGKDVNAHKKKIVLIMDEVDGMSAGDRGGVGALAKVCKKTEIPLILICNDRRLPKMKPFDHVTYDIPFRRPTVDQVRSRVATICAREGLKMPGPVMDALIEGSNKDIRQIINMLSSAKLDQDSMDFDQGKSMSKAWEKHVVLKPWDICHKLLGGGLFAPSSKASLTDKIELYFNDHEFSYLMIQENYLSTRPMLATNKGYSSREDKLKILELADKAAESISDGDLVDRMIHGSQQQWSLMPTHAVFSTVAPSSFMSGAMTGQTSFTQWLGNNSKFGKLIRYVKEIQSHMRLRSSGDRHEIRQQYLSVLWTRLVQRLQMEGKDCIEDVIDLMDSYFLTRDDFDYIIELGLGPQDQAGVKISPATKSNFTRL